MAAQPGFCSKYPHAEPRRLNTRLEALLDLPVEPRQAQLNNFKAQWSAEAGCFQCVQTHVARTPNADLNELQGFAEKAFSDGKITEEVYRQFCQRIRPTAGRKRNRSASPARPQSSAATAEAQPVNEPQQGIPPVREELQDDFGFEVGEEVAITGLEKSPQFNGVIGELLTYDQTGDRWEVKLLNYQEQDKRVDKTLAIKPTNLCLRQVEAAPTPEAPLLRMPVPQCGNPWCVPPSSRKDKGCEMLEQYRAEMGEGFTKEAKKRLFDKWYPGRRTGTSHRYRHLFHSWFRSMEIEAEYKKDGNVFYHPDLLIGVGSHAKVYLGIVPSDGREVAIKVYRDRTGSEHFSKEVRAMKENAAVFGIMQYITSFEQSKVWYEERRSTKRRREERVQVVILELMEGTLQEAMTTWADLHAGRHLDVVCSVSRSLLDILSRLNPVGDQGYVHRDINPDNIMIDCKGNIRLSDFGIARALHEDEAQLFSPTCGSCPQFTPPEVLYATLHKTNDLYSVGRVMIAMMLKDSSLSSMGDRKLDLEKLPAQWPWYKRHAFVRLVEALTHRDKQCRAYSDKLQDVSRLYQVLLAHPFFWPDDRAMDFLTMLGNSASQSSGQGSEEISEKLNHAVHQALQIAQQSNSSWWYEEVRDLDREQRVTWEKDWRSVCLLKFIRNMCLHEPQLKGELRDRFPALPVYCWEALLDHISEPGFRFGQYFT